MLPRSTNHARDDAIYSSLQQQVRRRNKGRTRQEHDALRRSPSLGTLIREKGEDGVNKEEEEVHGSLLPTVRQVV